MAAKDYRIDIRLRHFLWLWPLGVWFHSFQWMTRNRQFDVGTELTRWEWTPGMFLSPMPNLIISWAIWFQVAIYLAYGKHKKIAAGIFLALTAIHFEHLFLRAPNHFLLIVIPVLFILLLPLRSEDDVTTPLIVRLLRLLVTITYIFAVLHKLTPVYFDTDFSPATALVRPLYNNLGWPWFEHIMNLAPITGVAVEILLIYCLNVKRWRAAAFYMGLVFHGIMIAGLGASDYTCVMLALYPVFLDRDESKKLQEMLGQWSWRRFFVAWNFALVWVWACYFPVHTFDISTTTNDQSVFRYPFVVALVTLSTYTCLTLIPWLRGKVELGPQTKDTWTRRENVYTWIFAVLYTINCSTPYLGIKMYYSQAMFTGLNPAASNHYFIPRLYLFNNDLYLDVVSINIGAEPPPELDRQLDSFRFVLSNRERNLIHVNYLAAITEGACEYPELHPVSLSYRYPGEQEVRSFPNVCEQEEALPSSYPFNWYPEMTRKPRSMR